MLRSLRWPFLLSLLYRECYAGVVFRFSCWACYVKNVTLRLMCSDRQVDIVMLFMLCWDVRVEIGMLTFFISRCCFEIVVLALLCRYWCVEVAMLPPLFWDCYVFIVILRVHSRWWCWDCHVGVAALRALCRDCYAFWLCWDCCPENNIMTLSCLDWSVAMVMLRWLRWDWYVEVVIRD